MICPIVCLKECDEYVSVIFFSLYVSFVPDYRCEI